MEKIIKAMRKAENRLAKEGVFVKLSMSPDMCILCNLPEADPSMIPALQLKKMPPRLLNDSEALADVLYQAFREAQVQVVLREKAVKGIKSIVSNRDAILGCVMPRLTSPEYEGEHLEELVHKPYLDTAIIYYIETNDVLCSITKDIAKSSGITEEELDEAARENLCRKLAREFSIDSMAQMLGFLIDDSEILFVARYKGDSFGATSLLRPELFRDFAQSMNHDLYIIPSSIHEVLLTRTDRLKLEDLREMVRTINQCEVAPRDRLSDNVYIYHLDSNTITIA